MPLTAPDIIRLARLGRFEVSPEEIERFRVQLNAILERISELEEIEATNRETDKVEAGLRMRDDVSSKDELRLPVETLSEHMAADFFTLPRLL